MDNPSINIKSQICQKHNQLILYYDQNGRNQQCQVCMLEKGELINFEQIQKQYQEKIINNDKENDLQLQQFNTLKEGILKYKENLIVSLNNSIQQITDQINSIESQKQSMQQLDVIMKKYESIEDFTTCLNNNQKSNRQFRKQIVINLLLDLKQKISKIEFKDIILNWRKQMIQLVQVPQKILKQEDIREEQQKCFQKMEYELIHKVKKKLPINDIAIDQRNNTLIVGMNEGIIKIYDFKNGKVGGRIQKLQTQDNYISCLHCMKNTHSFVSVSHDNSIIIWSFDKVKKWKIKQTLNSHNNIVTCIIVNSNEDLLISASLDETVKFWRKLSDSWNITQTVDVGDKVYALSLNEKEDKLIASILQFKIVVMIVQKNQEWEFVQPLQIYEYGKRLCFTIQDQFAFQPRCCEQLKVYDYDGTKQQFYLKTKVKVQKVQDSQESFNLFPWQFIKNLNILIAKHGQFMNILKVNQNDEYQLIQSIGYQSDILHGKMTYDGDYLITWDYGSKEIQVRKLKFKKEIN